VPPAYPPCPGPRQPIAEALREGGGPVAGRLHHTAERIELTDASGTVELEGLDGERAADGDCVAGRLVPAGTGRFLLDGTVVLAPRLEQSPDPGLPERLPKLALRADALAAARRLFRERGFLEVETPSVVRCPGLEPHLRAFPVGTGGSRWLITSPELHLKRLLAGGAEKIVEFARAFRDEERGTHHRPEFLLLEWYRAYEELDALEADCEALVGALAALPGLDAASALPDCDLTPPFERTTVREALRSRTGLDLAELRDPDAFAVALSDRGIAVEPDDDWDDLFFRVWITEVEPGLGRSRPVFVHDYPASQAALARIREDEDGSWAERFELYVAGVEIANAFHELNDPAEQRRRHRADQEDRRLAGLPVYPLDESFLAALEAGMPPSSGIALGFDRLVALLADAASLDELTAFP
jgi:lysyl-tRNA synthetase class 2